MAEVDSVVLALSSTSPSQFPAAVKKLRAILEGLDHEALEGKSDQIVDCLAKNLGQSGDSSSCIIDTLTCLSKVRISESMCSKHSKKLFSIIRRIINSKSSGTSNTNTGMLEAALMCMLSVVTKFGDTSAEVIKVFPLLYSLCFDERKGIRDTAVKVLRASSPFVSHHFANAEFRSSFRQTYEPKLAKMVLAADPSFGEIFGLTVTLFGKNLHTDVALLNSLLKCEENALKVKDPAFKVQALQAWSKIIDSFALVKEIIKNVKRLNLLMLPLLKSEEVTSSVARAKLNLWIHLLEKLSYPVAHLNECVLKMLDHLITTIQQWPDLSNDVACTLTKLLSGRGSKGNQLPGISDTQFAEHSLKIFGYVRALLSNYKVDAQSKKELLSAVFWQVFSMMQPSLNDCLKELKTLISRNFVPKEDICSACNFSKDNMKVCGEKNPGNRVLSSLLEDLLLVVLDDEESKPKDERTPTLLEGILEVLVNSHDSPLPCVGKFLERLERSGFSNDEKLIVWRKLCRLTLTVVEKTESCNEGDQFSPKFDVVTNLLLLPFTLLLEGAQTAETKVDTLEKEWSELYKLVVSTVELEINGSAKDFREDLFKKIFDCFKQTKIGTTTGAFVIHALRDAYEITSRSPPQGTEPMVFFKLVSAANSSGLDNRSLSTLIGLMKSVVSKVNKELNLHAGAENIRKFERFWEQLEVDHPKEELSKQVKTLLTFSEPIFTGNKEAIQNRIENLVQFTSKNKIENSSGASATSPTSTPVKPVHMQVNFLPASPLNTPKPDIILSTRSPRTPKGKTKEEFVVIPAPTTPKSRLLTEHQKEKMKEGRADIPAMYNDYSQDTHTICQNSSQSQSLLSKVPSFSDVVLPSTKDQAPLGKSTTPLHVATKRKEVGHIIDNSPEVCDMQAPRAAEKARENAFPSVTQDVSVSLPNITKMLSPAGKFTVAPESRPPGPSEKPVEEKKTKTRKRKLDLPSASKSYTFIDESAVASPVKIGGEVTTISPSISETVRAFNLSTSTSVKFTSPAHKTAEISVADIVPKKRRIAPTPVCPKQKRDKKSDIPEGFGTQSAAKPVVSPPNIPGNFEALLASPIRNSAVTLPQELQKTPSPTWDSHPQPRVSDSEEVKVSEVSPPVADPATVLPDGAESKINVVETLTDTTVAVEAEAIDVAVVPEVPEAARCHVAQPENPPVQHTEMALVEAVSVERSDEGKVADEGQDGEGHCHSKSQEAETRETDINSPLNSLVPKSDEIVDIVDICFDEIFEKAVTESISKTLEIGIVQANPRNEEVEPKTPQRSNSVNLSTSEKDQPMLKRSSARAIKISRELLLLSQTTGPNDKAGASPASENRRESRSRKSTSQPLPAKIALFSSKDKTPSSKRKLPKNYVDTPRPANDSVSIKKDTDVEVITSQETKSRSPVRKGLDPIPLPPLFGKDSAKNSPLKNRPLPENYVDTPRPPSDETKNCTKTGYDSEDEILSKRSKKKSANLTSVVSIYSRHPEPAKLLLLEPVKPTLVGTGAIEQEKHSPIASVLPHDRSSSHEPSSSSTPPAPAITGSSPVDSDSEKEKLEKVSSLDMSPSATKRLTRRTSSLENLTPEVTSRKLRGSDGQKSSSLPVDIAVGTKKSSRDRTRRKTEAVVLEVDSQESTSKSRARRNTVPPRTKGDEPVDIIPSKRTEENMELVTIASVAETLSVSDVTNPAENPTPEKAETTCAPAPITTLSIVSDSDSSIDKDFTPFSDTEAESQETLRMQVDTVLSGLSSPSKLDAEQNQIVREVGSETVASVENTAADSEKLPCERLEMDTDVISSSEASEVMSEIVLSRESTDNFVDESLDVSLASSSEVPSSPVRSPENFPEPVATFCYDEVLVVSPTPAAISDSEAVTPDETENKLLLDNRSKNIAQESADIFEEVLTSPRRTPRKSPSKPVDIGIMDIVKCNLSFDSTPEEIIPSSQTGEKSDMTLPRSSLGGQPRQNRFGKSLPVSGRSAQLVSLAKARGRQLEKESEESSNRDSVAGPSLQSSDSNQEKENETKPWKRHSYSPNASPSSSILKRKIEELDLSSPPSKSRKVTFRTPEVSDQVQIPRKEGSELSPRMPMLRKRRILGKQDSVALCSDEETSENLTSPQSQIANVSQMPESQESTQDASLSLSPFPSTPVDSLERELPICPELVNCKDDVSRIACDLTTPLWAGKLTRNLKERKIISVGDLCSRPERIIHELDIQPPKIQTAKSVMQRYLTKWRKLSKNEDLSGSREAVATGRKVTDIPESSPPKKITTHSEATALNVIGRAIDSSTKMSLSEVSVGESVESSAQSTNTITLQEMDVGDFIPVIVHVANKEVQNVAMMGDASINTEAVALQDDQSQTNLICTSTSQSQTVEYNANSLCEIMKSMPKDSVWEAFRSWNEDNQG